MSEETLLYAIPFVETQKKPLNDHCFGDCGKIALGAIFIPEVGECFVCTEKDCPHEKGHTEPLGASDWTGDPVCIRGLKFSQAITGE